jgi:hypothetical protein
MTRRTAVVALALAAITHGSPSAAEGYPRFTVGAFFGAGMATSTRESPGYNERPRFAGSGGAYLDLSLSNLFALGVGMGVVGKGDGTSCGSCGVDWMGVVRVRYLEIPLGAKLDLHGFRIGLALALDVALTGANRWYDPHADDFVDHEWDDFDWKYYRRFNFGPRVTLGYAFHVGHVAIVPGFAWSMDVLDNTRTHDDDLWWGAFGEWRNMNVMLELALEYGFGGRP